MTNRLACVAAAIFFATPINATTAAEIVSHEAVYRVSLKDLRIKGWSEYNKGVMEYKLSRDCYHWSIDRRLEFEIRFTDGRQTHLIINEKLRESVRQGRYFWFWTRTTLNGGTASIITGVAERPEENKRVRIEVAKVEVDPNAEVKDDGPTIEELVATPEELVAIEARKKAEEAERAAKEAASAGETADKTDGAGQGETVVAAEVKGAEAGKTDGTKADDAAAVAAAEEADKAENEKAEEELNETNSRLLGTIIAFDWPDTMSTEIPQEEGTIFPITAIKLQLDALATKSLQRAFTVFDGSSADGPYRVRYEPVTTAKVSAFKPKGDVELLETPSMRYRASYLPWNDEGAKPVRVETIKMHQNGVVSEMVIDYGPFSVRVDLVWIKALPQPDNCGP